MPEISCWSIETHFGLCKKLFKFYLFTVSPLASQLQWTSGSHEFELWEWCFSIDGFLFGLKYFHIYDSCTPSKKE